MSEFVLDDYDLIDTSVMQIVPPGQTDPIGTITFAGPGHPRTIALVAQIQRRLVKDEADKEQARVNGRKWKPETIDLDQRRVRNMDAIVGRIVTWSGIRRRADDGSIVDLPFSEDAARQLFLDPRKEWLLEAASQFIVAERSFTRSSVSA